MPPRVRAWLGWMPVAALAAALAGCAGQPGFANISLGGFGAPYGGEDVGGADLFGITPPYGWGSPFGASPEGWGGYGGWRGEGDD
ncbi:MAG: hypothetical protein M0Z28_25140 [Rhodospirillales bacterium]|nr:hypothetical protein [Rhodospirillales bacterium]